MADLSKVDKSWIILQHLILGTTTLHLTAATCDLARCCSPVVCAVSHTNDHGLGCSEV